ncbi:6076_t:CDS:2, partial [Dentiscutata heterogama]
KITFEDLVADLQGSSFVFERFALGFAATDAELTLDGFLFNNVGDKVAAQFQVPQLPVTNDSMKIQTAANNTDKDNKSNTNTQ